MTSNDSTSETDESQSTGSRWEDTGDICSDCSANGKHLVVDNELVYCGRCRNLIKELD